MKVYTMDGQVHESRPDVRVKFWTPEVLTVLQSWTHRDDVIAGFPLCNVQRWEP